MKYIYIIGSGHSGSTLLDLMLSNAGEVFSMGEILRLGQAMQKGTLCSCSARVSDCAVWKPILDPFSTQDINTFSYGADRDTINNAVAHDRFVERYPAFLSRIAEVTGESVFCDSSKLLARLTLLSRIKDIDLYVLYLMRHPGGVVRSQMRKGRAFFQQSLVWLKRNFKTAHFLRSRGLRYKQLDYEKLVRHPENEIMETFSFFDSDCSPDLIVNFSKLRHLVEGNRIRMHHQKLQLREPEKWQNDFSYAQYVLLSLINALSLKRNMFGT